MWFDIIYVYLHHVNKLMNVELQRIQVWQNVLNYIDFKTWWALETREINKRKVVSWSITVLFSFINLKWYIYNCVPMIMYSVYFLLIHSLLLLTLCVCVCMCMCECEGKMKSSSLHETSGHWVGTQIGVGVTN